MFWDKGYAPSQNIEALLEKENVTVEEFLDEDDILQECKTLKKSIVNYFTRPDVIKRLVELITTEPSEDLPMAQRFRHANMACEILTLGIPSLDEKLLSDVDTLKLLYSYLENEPPLNPLLSSFFSKTFSMLFTKKPEQDWFLYQQMCLKLLENIKSQQNFLDLICKHFSTPVVPDLILQMMRDVDGGDIKRNLYEWLTEEKLVERLIAILGNSQETDKHENVAEFLCDLIQHGRSMRQNEQENGSFEPAFSGSNPLLKNLESEATIEALLNVILDPNAMHGSIVSGISVVLTLLKPVSIIDSDDANSYRLQLVLERENEINDQIVSTVIRVVAPRLKHFNELLKNPPKKPQLVINATRIDTPFGNTRLQVCRLFSVLLKTKKLEISKAICETDFFETVMALFQEYCWNNFLHCEVEKYFETIFDVQSNCNNSNSNNNSTHASDGSYNGRKNNRKKNTSENSGGGDKEKDTDYDTDNENDSKGENQNGNTTTENSTENATNEEKEEKSAKTENDLNNVPSTKTTDESKALAAGTEIPMGAKYDDANQSVGPSLLQTHVIVNCKIITKLLDCWQQNNEMENIAKLRRLGYMGHLIKILKHIKNCISEYEHIGALIESNLSDASERELWQKIMNSEDGELTKAIATQSRLLANCNAHDLDLYAKGFPGDNEEDISWVYSLNWESFVNAEDSIILGNYNTNFVRNRADDEDEIDDDVAERNNDNINTDDSTFGGNALSMPTFINFWDKLLASDATTGTSTAITTTPSTIAVTTIPTTTTTNSNQEAWADFGNEHFADFDAHFNSFVSDMGDSLSACEKTTDDNSANTGVVVDANDLNTNEIIGTTTNNSTLKCLNIAAGDAEQLALKDNNANLEKLAVFVNKCDPIASEANKFSDDDDDNNDNEEKDNKLQLSTATGVVTMSVDDDLLDAADQIDDDDFDDDEGMWTKPLGATSNTIDTEQQDSPESMPAIVNGPSKDLLPSAEATNELEINALNQLINTTDAKTSRDLLQIAFSEQKDEAVADNVVVTTPTATCEEELKLSATTETTSPTTSVV